MVTVDSKGRIVLPQDVREQLGLDAGAEVDVREEDGRAVVEPEESAEDIIEDLERRIEEAAANREPTPYEELDVQSREHVETIRRGANESRTDCDEATDE